MTLRCRHAQKDASLVSSCFCQCIFSLDCSRFASFSSFSTPSGEESRAMSCATHQSAVNWVTFWLLFDRGRWTLRSFDSAARLPIPLSGKGIMPKLRLLPSTIHRLFARFESSSRYIEICLSAHPCSQICAVENL